MSDNIAILDGYTKQMMAYSADNQNNIFLLVKPDTDFYDRFKAWSNDIQEYVMINGWLWSFEEIE